MFNVCPNCGEYCVEKSIDPSGPFAVCPHCHFGFASDYDVFRIKVTCRIPVNIHAPWSGAGLPAPFVKMLIDTGE